MGNDITVRIGLAGASQVTAGLKQVQASVASAFGALKSLALPLAVAAGFAGITAGLKDVIELGGKLKDMSAATGVAASKLMVYSTALRDAGVNADNMGQIFAKMSVALEDAFSGRGAGANGLAKVGLDIQDLINKDPAAQFETIAAAIARLPSPSERTAAAMQIFGKGAQELMPFFRDGGALSDASKTLGQLPGVMERNKDIIDAIGDSFGHLKIKAEQLFAGFLDITAPMLKSITDLIDEIDLTPIGQKIGAMVVLVKDAWQKGQISELIGLSLEAGFELGRIGIMKVLKALVDTIGSINFWKPAANAFVTAMAEAAKTVAAFMPGSGPLLAAAAGAGAAKLKGALGTGGSQAPGTSALDELNRRINEIISKRNDEAKKGADVEHTMTINVRQRINLLEQERDLKEQIKGYDGYIARIQADFTLTEAEKYRMKKAALEDEKGILQELVALTQAQAEAEADPAAQQALLNRVDSYRGQLAAKDREGFGMGADPESFSQQWSAAFTQVRNEWGTVASNIANVGKTAMQSLTRTMGNALDDMIWRTGSLKDLWKSFAHTLTSSVTQALSQMFAGWISGIFAKRTAETSAAAAETAAKTPGALMDSISSFGIAAAVGAAALLAAMAAFGGFREHGGPVTAGQAYVVGEKRPELFIPDTSGVIMPTVSAAPQTAGTAPFQNQSNEVHVHTYANFEDAVKGALARPGVRNVIVDSLRGRRTELGIQS